MAEYTPGPWHMPTGYSDFQVHGPDGNRVADTMTLTRHAAECEANARLIAAAPDLFRIGQGLLAYSHSEPDVYVLNALLAELEEVTAGVTEPVR